MAFRRISTLSEKLAHQKYVHARAIFDEPFSFLKTETSTSAGWNSNPGVPSTVSGGQQQLATQESAQVVNPVQASYPSVQASSKSEDNSYINTGSAAVAPQLSASSYPSTHASLTSTESTSVSTSTTQSSGINQPSATSANKAYSNNVPPAVGTYNVTAPATSNSTSDSYPVYYISNPEEPSVQQQSSQTGLNAKLNSSVPSSPSVYATSQGGNDGGFPIYYVGFEEEKYNTSKAEITSNTSSIPAASLINTWKNNHTNEYPVYYVTSYNKETPNAPKVTNSNSSITSENKTSNEYANVEDAMATGNVPGTKAVPNSPISYKIINITSASHDVSLSVAPPSTAAPATVPSPPHKPAFQPAATSYNNPSNQAQPSLYQTAAPSSQYQQAYNYYGYPASSPSPATYQTNGAPSPAAYPAPSPALQPIANDGYPANQTFSSSAQSSVTQSAASSYQETAPAAAPVASPSSLPSPSPSPPPAPAPVAAPATSPAPPIATNNGYPTNQTFSSSAQSSVTQTTANSYQEAAPAAAPAPVASPSPSLSPSPAPVPAPAPSPAPPIATNNGYPTNQTFSSSAQSSAPQPVNSSFQAAAPAAAPAPFAAPAPSPAPAPAPASSVISGVSSSPPFPPAAKSSSSFGNNHATTSTHESSPAHNEYPSLPNLDPEYENASYIIASPPEKDTVLFLPPPSLPLSTDSAQGGKSNSSVVSNLSSQKTNTTTVLNANRPHPASITIPSVISNQTTSTDNSAVLPPALNTTKTEEDITESPIIRIPENITLPGWELQNSTFSNITFMSSSPLEPPSTTPAPAVPILITSTTPTAPPAPVSSNKTVSSDLLNIPLGPLLDSLAVTTPPQATKLPQPHLFTTPPPKPVPAPGTTKPPPAAFQTTSKPTEKAKELGFGDKYLGMKRGVCYFLIYVQFLIGMLKQLIGNANSRMICCFKL